MNFLTHLNQLLIILFLCHITEGQRTPTISFVSPNISTTRSSTIDMDCSILYGTEYPVLWMKIGSDKRPIPLSSGSSLIIRDNRFALRYDTASATFTLQLKDVQRSDEGRYECQIIVGINNKVTQDLYLRVQEPPVINDNSTRSVVVNEFESATLECTAKGSPPPRIEWRRADNAVLPTGGIIYRGNKLKIHSVKKEDRGTYFCVADNNVGKAAKRHIALEVEFAPHFVDEKANQVVQQALGFEVGLICSVEAFPPATITWIHAGIQKSDNEDNLSIYRGPGGDGLTNSNLRVLRLGRDDLGEYRCKAGNKLGQAETVFTIEDTWVPNCEQDCVYDYNSAGSRVGVVGGFVAIIVLTIFTL
eukprot:TRINITY_DN8280_c0_g1_i1.p1 TRINITY_DN8280_c0_g1~~TRINITY_DN8280_c0_g1_i1.p1  ORF type:complete len:361 (-),score=64.81 TRINITY_DN8280_c0_g1_i1:111-1193(-)